VTLQNLPSKILKQGKVSMLIYELKNYFSDYALKKYKSKHDKTQSEDQKLIWKLLFQTERVDEAQKPQTQ
jgi:hypothetical protein